MQNKVIVKLLIMKIINNDSSISQINIKNAKLICYNMNVTRFIKQGLIYAESQFYLSAQFLLPLNFDKSINRLTVYNYMYYCQILNSLLLCT